jgi:predicted nuclease of predicted toxin-antitoxin system
VKLLLDEMLSPVIARELRARGYDVQAVAGHPEREALPDPEVLALARAERRAIVTNNVRDFRLLHVEAVMPGGPGHFGMIFMSGHYRRTKSDIGRIIAALEAKIAQYPGDEGLANAEEWPAVGADSASGAGIGRREDQLPLP